MFWERIQDSLWLLLFLPLFTVCGLRLLPHLRLPRLGNRQAKAAGDAQGLQPGQAASTALAATVGTGNIVGTAQAITMGGPGAVFWLWCAAILGCGIKYAEIYQGQRFGGAMGYIAWTLGRSAAAFYAALAALSALVVGNMAQMNGAVNALCGGEHALPRLLLGLLLVLLLWRQLCGGVGGVGRACAGLVPPMSVCYVLALGYALFSLRARIPAVLGEILDNALAPSAPIGAAGGLALRKTILWGLRRGAFSNEAGLGTAANIHAEVQTAQPQLHALWGVFEVLVDTLVLCTLTALVILCSGTAIPWGSLPGPELLQQALAPVYGEGSAAVFLAASLGLFGFSTVLGVYVCALRCVRWLWGDQAERRYRRLYLLCAFCGCLLPTGLIWQMADGVNVLLAVPNLLALLLLSGSTVRALRSIRRGKP